MRLIEERPFERQFAKLPKEIQVKARERIHILVTDSANPVLHDHKLNPPFEGYRSINITGNYRLVYKKTEPDTYYLRAIGTHHQLYGS